jgi:Protein of unknown function (DUF2848)
MTHLIFDFIDVEQNQRQTLEVERAIIAGWTSRDQAAVELHIKELEELGVKRPPHTPCYYPVSVSRLTHDSSVEMLGEDSSGEVEFVMLKHQGQLWIGLGSDHTDRKVESYDVAVSKQVCDKPIADQLWRFTDIQEHWDQLTMSSYIVVNNERVLYQRGCVNEMLHPLDLIERYEKTMQQTFSDHCVMFGGTFAAIGGIQQSLSFEFELNDPVLNRSINHCYQTNTIK